MIKRRGKLGLIKVKAQLDEAVGWIKAKMAEPFTIGSTTGMLRQFIVEPFVPHRYTILSITVRAPPIPDVKP